jgi:hypothetical protein
MIAATMGADARSAEESSATLSPQALQEIAELEAEIDRIEAGSIERLAALPDNQVQQIELLGKLMLYDKQLSVNRNEACAFCHMPETGFTGPVSELNRTTGSYPRDVFAWQEQIHTDRETIPNAKPISAFDFRLAYAITQYTNKHSRKAWPKQETLAANLGVDVRTVGRGIANLVRRGHLSVTRRGREQSAIYRMILQDRTSVSDHDEVRQDTDVRSKPQDKTSVSSRPDTGVLKTGHQCLIEPLLEPLLEPEERGAPQARPATGASSGGSIRGPEPLNNMGGTIVDDGDDGIGVALRAPPPDHLERGFEHKSEQARWHGKVIDQDGVEFKPPPPHQRRPVPKDWWEAAMEGMNRGGRA